MSIKQRVDELMTLGLQAGQAKEADDLSKRLGRMLRGRDPGVQGATLLLLLATFLAGHHPELRDEVFALHVAAVQDLVPIIELELFGPDGFPGFAAQDPEPPPPARNKRSQRRHR